MWKFTDEDKDLILVSLIAHDGYKSGFVQEKYTRADHPKIICKQLSGFMINMITAHQRTYILGNIESHMGKWNRDYKTGEEILPVPITTSQRFTHMVDYLASRKCIEFNFDVNVNRE